MKMLLATLGALVIFVVWAFEVSGDFMWEGSADCSRSSGRIWERVKERPVSGITTSSVASPVLSTECAVDAVSNAEAPANFFAENFTRIAEQLAQGSGKELRVLGKLLGCPITQLSRFQELGQHNFEVLFPTIHPEPEQSLGEIKKMIQMDELLRSSCRISS